MFLLWNFFYKIEKYLYFFIKKFIIKKKNQTFLKNIKLHTQKLLSQYKILNKCGGAKTWAFALGLSLIFY